MISHPGTLTYCLRGHSRRANTFYPASEGSLQRMLDCGKGVCVGVAHNSSWYAVSETPTSQWLNVWSNRELSTRSSLLESCIRSFWPRLKYEDKQIQQSELRICRTDILCVLHTTMQCNIPQFLTKRGQNR